MRSKTVVQAKKNMEATESFDISGRAFSGSFSMLFI